jgi:hypothetical protein
MIPVPSRNGTTAHAAALLIPMMLASAMMIPKSI